MYITSSLFDTAASTSTSDCMAGIQQHQASQPTGPSKKRRRDDGDELYNTPTTKGTINPHANTIPSTTKTPCAWSPSISPKGSVYYPSYNDTPLRVSTTFFPSSTFHPLDMRPVKQLKRKKLASASTPTSFLPSTAIPTPQPIPESAESILKPCHICHKKPTRRSDLKGYFDCQGCEQRACQVCERICLGCQKVVCSRCCREVGDECESWCGECEEKIWQSGG